jgi:sec-independent protein translocase protein TatB
MFDITSSKLLLLGVVALLVIGPKDLPALLRTIGKYMGIIKRQAAEFRSQFDEAMRESELSELKKQVETLGSDAEAQMRAAERTVEEQLADARKGVDTDLGTGDPIAGETLPAAGSEGSAGVSALNGTTPHPAEAIPSPEPEPPAPSAATPGEPGRAPEKSGA